MKSVVAGGTDDFLLARHLRLRGTQAEIGRALAEEVQEAFPPVPVVAEPLPVLDRARRRWFEQHWPQHYARMKGIAEVVGPDPTGDEGTAGDLPAVPFTVGCSALWCPPSFATDRHAWIARNFDFVTGSALEVAGLPVDPAQPPMMSRPYVIETYPDEGRASIAVAACDLSGCFDGCNEAGLAIVVFADDESRNLRPAHRLQVGVHELQLPRFVLDTCSCVDEAIEALYGAKQYDNFITCHYLIADADGDAFVWERDTHNAEHIVRSGDGPMCITNYLLHRHESIAALPEDEPTSNMYARARILDQRAANTPLSATDLRAALAAVSVQGPNPVARTLWCSQYDLDQRSLTIDFYLGEGPDGEQRRSTPLSYALESAN